MLLLKVMNIFHVKCTTNVISVVYVASLLSKSQFSENHIKLRTDPYYIAIRFITDIDFSSYSAVPLGQQLLTNSNHTSFHL